MLTIRLKEMNLEAHISRQMSSGQIPVQADSQLSGLQQQYRNPHDNGRIREFMRGKIWEFITNKRPQGLTLTSLKIQKLHDIVKHLEELLYRSARSLDEYEDMSTLQTRLSEAIRHIVNDFNRPLQHPNPSPFAGGGVEVGGATADDFIISALAILEKHLATKRQEVAELERVVEGMKRSISTQKEGDKVKQQKG